MDLVLPFNMDFQQPVHIKTRHQPWLASPLPGVERIPLAREDTEQGHATSIVRYHAGASFHAHNHPGGEEILVLDGIFSDETGDYPAGTYFRNPIGFRHAPFSTNGCTLLVKLHQFQADDEAHVCINTHSSQWQHLNEEGSVQLLHQHNQETVRLYQLAKGSQWQLDDAQGGEEFFVLRGEVKDEEGLYSAGDWLRTPANGRTRQVLDDSLVWVKAGHLI